MQILFCIMQEICAIFRLDVQRMNPLSIFAYPLAVCEIEPPIFPLSGNPKSAHFSTQKVTFLPRFIVRSQPHCPTHFQNFFDLFPLFGIPKKRNFFRLIGIEAFQPVSALSLPRLPSQRAVLPSPIFRQSSLALFPRPNAEKEGIVSLRCVHILRTHLPHTIPSATAGLDDLHFG